MHDAAALELLAARARDTAARSALSAEGVPARLAGTLDDAVAAWAASPCELAPAARLLWLLRALRNLAAGEVSAQDSLCATGAPATLAQLLLLLAEPASGHAQRGPLLGAALELLGNACVGHESNQTAAWCAPTRPAATGAR